MILFSRCEARQQLAAYRKYTGPLSEHHRPFLAVQTPLITPNRAPPVGRRRNTNQIKGPRNEGNVKVEGGTRISARAGVGDHHDPSAPPQTPTLSSRNRRSPEASAGDVTPRNRYEHRNYGNAEADVGV